MADAITNILQAIMVMGLFVLGLWTKRWIAALNGTVTALKGTVEAQSQTIAAQNTLLANLGTVLNAADTPKMIERLEAYKKFVDHEKEAFQQDLKRTSAEERQKILNDAARDAGAMIDVIADFMPHVPIEKRKKTIERELVNPILKRRMHRLAEEAPDSSPTLLRYNELVALLHLDPLKLEEKEEK